MEYKELPIDLTPNQHLSIQPLLAVSYSVSRPDLMLLICLFFSSLERVMPPIDRFMGGTTKYMDSRC